jgi:hypothetical protein
MKSCLGLCSFRVLPVRVLFVDRPVFQPNQLNSLLPADLRTAAFQKDRVAPNPIHPADALSPSYFTEAAGFMKG